MYRNPATYDVIAKTIIDIYIDYDIKTFPVNEKEVCHKLGIALIPYSKMPDDICETLIKLSDFGFFIPGNKANSPTIYFNDINKTVGAQRFTIFHEIKHYVFEDKDDSEDDLADYFARYMMCPIPYLVLKGTAGAGDIAVQYDTSISAAHNVYSNIRNRVSKYGRKIFDYEVKLIEHLDPVLIERYRLK